MEAIVDTLYFRPEKTLPPIKARELSFLAGRGIDKDCHAHPLSPRQVLIATSDAYHDFQLPNNTLRENILLNFTLRSDAEQFESGDVLFIDNGSLALRLTFPCEPCGRLNRTRPNLCRDIKGHRGWLARVVSSGLLRPDDRLRLTKSVYPPFATDWHERVTAVAQLLPSNCSLSYSQLAVLAGVASGYCRAFPRLLRSHQLPTERIVPSSIAPLPLLEWAGHEVFKPELL